MTSSNHKLLEAIRQERSRLAQNQHVPVDALKVLVFTTYTCGQISEGKACELLNVGRLAFRDIRCKWLDSTPKMQTIWDNQEYIGGSEND
ncbi:hypothetical protein kac65v151_gp093 [Nodularia phage vB_NspS-kac65v151]|jgi:hypothetical protein|uniref:Uncharacterized protein n=2 Tax=Ravarandavirus kac65v151 TaxID=2845689 RepID=A0A482MHA6_9CAUD|nr:hypothetical protein HWC12_gp093 [Nodularia phage vB_NspS-kac65v151]QBQ73123.1 hypothetical protein kac65v151_gp093 [Nodularia phage vB_NspS-kac65v151]QBQ73331.1 hypothetical protein kac65v161_gp093 [Nodularia phage vB_NspS-kac65v161]